MSRQRTLARTLVVAAAVAALTLVCVSSAFADPNVPVMHFDDLRTALASGHLNGYMKTVVEGSDITTIPLTVLSVPKTGGANDDLIMFEATGTLIQKYGGIVAGMSGSPVYVDDAGTDKLIGAVSYGDEFTLGGTGLATPIDAMTQIEDDFATAAPLSAPVITSNGIFNRIIVAPNPEAYAGAAAAGAFVARPLSAVYIGGMNPKSVGYTLLKKDLTARGVDVVALGAPLAGGGGDAALFSTEMTAGAAIAAQVTRGDMWVGGIGTVTYANDGNVLAFGHPAYWSGATSLYMSNAWIEGVWPNADEPYKVGEPGATTGTVTEDRNAGILGKLGVFADETTITARARNVDTGHVTTSTVYVPRSLIRTGFADSSLVSMGAYMAGSKLFDQRQQPGSARTTTTVDVSDGSHVYHISIPNYVDSADDIPSAAVADVQTAIGRLQSVLAFGTQSLQVLDVDITGEYSATRVGAQIVGVDAPNGLHVGANVIRISAIQYGVDATQTVDAVLNIPSGTSLNGSLLVSAISNAGGGSTSITTPSGMPLTIDGNGNAVPLKRKTISQIASELNATLPDTDIAVTYAPGVPAGDLLDGAPVTSGGPLTTSVVATWPVSGQAAVGVTSVHAQLLQSVVNYGDPNVMFGTVDGPSTAPVVSLYATTAGSTEALVATTTAEDNGDGTFDFDFTLFNSYTTNTTFRVHVDGTDASTSADTTLKMGVHAIVSLKASATKVTSGKSITLSTSVIPNTAAGGTAVFEQQVGKSWVKIASKTLTVSGSKAVASTSWKPGKGTRKVRVRYLGGTFNAATTSGIMTVSVK